MRFVFPPIRRSRNPLVRILSVIAGLAVVGVLLVFGTIVLGLLVAGSVVFFAIRQWKLARAGHGARRAGPSAASHTHAPDVLEGEFAVIQQGRPVHH